MCDDVRFYRPLSRNEKKVFALHMVIALLCIPLYWVAPALFGLIVSPYLVYLILRPRSEYLLPLIIHTFYGSQQQYMMLLACFVYVLTHIERIRLSRLLVPFCVYLLGLPFFVWYTFARYNAFGGGIGHGGTFEGLCYYFAFAPFFWAALTIKRIDRSTFHGLVYLSFWFVLSGFIGVGKGVDGESPMFDTYSRFASWGGPFLFVLSLWSIREKIERKIKIISAIGAALFVLGFLHIGSSLIPFHLMSTALFGALIVYLNRLRSKFVHACHPVAWVALATIAVFSAIGKFENREIDMAGRGGYEENNTVRDVKSLEERIYYKFYGDRAPVWTAAYNAIERQFSGHWFFVDINPLYGELQAENGRVVVIEMQAHNLMLELFRLYGLYGGGVCMAVFLLLIGKRYVYDARKSCNTILLPILACAVGHMIFGYLGGQYLVTKNFSFTVFGLLGTCYSLNRQVSTSKVFRSLFRPL